MNKKDIVVGREYAVTTGRAKQNARPEDYPEYTVVRVLVVNLHEKSPVPYTYHGEQNRVVETVVKEQFTDTYPDTVSVAPNNNVKERFAYVPPRRVLCEWDDYQTGVREAYERKQRWAKERDERTVKLDAQAESLSARQKALGLVGPNGEPLFKFAVDEHRGSASLYFTGNVSHVEALLDRMEGKRTDGLGQPGKRG